MTQRRRTRNDAETHARGELVLPVQVRLSFGGLGGCSPEFQMTSGELITAGSYSPFPLPQEDATRMLAASHHYSYSDSKPPTLRLRAGRHSARDPAEAAGGDVRSAPWATTRLAEPARAPEIKARVPGT